jgi:hypothetical protein
MLVTPPLLVGQIWQTRGQTYEFRIESISWVTEPHLPYIVRSASIGVAVQYLDLPSRPSGATDIQIQFWTGTGPGPAGYPAYHFYRNQSCNTHDMVRLLYCPTWSTGC